MPDAAGWSLTGRLRSRTFLVTAGMALLASISVALSYSHGSSEFQERALFNLANQVGRNLPLDAPPDQLRRTIERNNPIFQRHADAYAWALLDWRGQLIVQSDPQLIDRHELPTGVPPQEWIAPSGGGWIGGKSLRAEDELGHVVIAMRADPASLVWSALLRFVALHIVLPWAPFVVLILAVTSGTVTATLKPLKSLANQAQRASESGNLHPLDARDAPLELTELVRALNSALAAVTASTERERNFVLDASHALRTPLAAIKARLELDGESITSAKLKSEVDALVRLSSQLLASASAERLVVDTSAEANLGDIARGVVTGMAPLAAEAELDLGLGENYPDVVVRGDRDAIEHALKNLVENALRHTPASGAVTVTVGSEPPSLVVADGGPGIPVSRRDTIFSRFGNAGLGNGSGTGLGLSIVKRIMAAHDGSVEVDSAPQGGAMLRLVFPSRGPGRLVSDRA